MRLAHISDFHFTHLTWNPFRLFSKRALGNLNWIALRRNHFFEGQLDPLPALFEELGVDLVLLGGDFSTTALREEFEKAAQFTQKIKQPWIAIPGNHDHYTHKSSKNKDFYRFFTNPKGRISLPFHLKEDRLEVHELGVGWKLIALDTALETNLYSSEGLFSEELEDSLEKVLKLIPEEESILLLNHYPFFQNGSRR